MATEAGIGSLFSFIARFSAKNKSVHSAPPTGLSFLLEGRIERVEGGKCWVEQDYFEICGDTWVIGSIVPGSRVKAKGRFKNGARVATKVIINN